MTPKQAVKSIYPQASVDYLESQLNAFYIRTSIPQGHGHVISGRKKTPRAAWLAAYNMLRAGGHFNEPAIWRFKAGDVVWVRDRRVARGGFQVVSATVEMRTHQHFNEWPEWYLLNGHLYWREYPGCRVFATRKEALNTPLPKSAA